MIKCLIANDNMILPQIKVISLMSFEKYSSITILVAVIDPNVHDDLLGR